MMKLRIVEANWRVGHMLKEMNQTRRAFQWSIDIAHAQGLEWLLETDAFQDAIAIASINTKMQVYDEVCRKVHGGEEIGEQGKSLTPPFEMAIRLRWDLNEEGVPIFPPSILEEGEDMELLPSFKAWVAGTPGVEAKLASAPSEAQPAPFTGSNIVTIIPTVDLTHD
ncbi:hypothetical protein SLEP1_g22463 [Rubroshorea leprosula]|uniref:Uncharacterized protein n=1 Tax=Rubroshorea leprosula TaxID=152421 RepID=A0AAV5JK64_9ROSI|nr:hypothetical protein SLEP1_g22463 [Rubroshorea leprosula]